MKTKVVHCKKEKYDRYLRSAVDEINRAEEQLADIQDKLIELKNL